MKSDESQIPFNILLADDDMDDRFFFAKALKEMTVFTNLVTVNNGEELMDYLFKNETQLPHVLFLDLSMPRKTGFECLAEIKENNNLKKLPVVMYTTSYTKSIDFEDKLKNTLNRMGAQSYIRKPGDFKVLKQVIHEALVKVIQEIDFKH
jgi:CheY-like chemotaxis protein